jgi:ADP-ribose pyrophosphatase
MDQTKAWREISRTRVYDDYRHIDKVLYELPDGTQKYFDIEASTGGATIVALTPEQQVIMVKQYRPGPDLTLTEFPGGVIDPGEEPIVAAARELLEETGYAGELKFVGMRHLDAYSRGRHYGFVATNCRKIAEPQLDDGEFLSIELISLGGMGFLALDSLGLL